jgi:Tfp pilus assembly protein PilO
MSRLSKDKRNQVILVALMTLLVVVGLWYSLIRYQQENLKKIDDQRNVALTKLSQIQDTIKHSKELEEDLLSVSKTLATEEEDMVSGDLYSAMVNSIRKFKLRHKIEIPQFDSAGTAVDVNLLPKFPYKQVTMTISGTAHYHDLGKFIADFENQFPSSRILNLELVPASASGPEEKDKLAFRMDIVCLVHPDGSHPANTP